MPSVEDFTVHDDDQSDIIAWPSDPRGRVVNYRMTPERALSLAAALELAVAQQSELWQQWYPEVEGLREAARRSKPARTPGLPLNRAANPLPRVRVASTLADDAPRPRPRGTSP